jgi:hypothetical protein
LVESASDVREKAEGFFKGEFNFQKVLIRKVTQFDSRD